MARQEQERENLMREATALTQRIEIQIAGQDAPIVIGFRRDGSGSLFIGADPVFQFNKRNELRRGFLDGNLIKAENGGLVELKRCRTPNEVQLHRRELDLKETKSYLRLFQNHAGKILAAIAADEFTVVEQVPPNLAHLDLVANWLKTTLNDTQIADQPNVA